MGQSLTRPGNGAQEIGLCAQTIIAGISSNVQESDDRWIALAAGQLGKSEDVIRKYLGHSHDNLLLSRPTSLARSFALL
jgi:hypothetical protein